MLSFMSLNYLSNFLHNDKQFQVTVGKIRDAEKIPGIATTLSPPRRETCGLWTLRPGSQALTGARGLALSARRPCAVRPLVRTPPLFLSNSDLGLQLGRGFLSPNLFSLGGKHNLSSAAGWQSMQISLTVLYSVSSPRMQNLLKQTSHPVSRRRRRRLEGPRRRKEVRGVRGGPLCQ